MPAFRTEAADKDLREIAYQIGIESGRPATADKIVDQLVDCCDQLADLSAISQLEPLLPNWGAEFDFIHFIDG